MKAQRVSLDRISKLPSPVVETILCCVPLRDAVRTSILSREWRYTWTKIPKLVFNDYEVKVSTDQENQISNVLEQTFGVPSKTKKFTKTCKIFLAIYQVLLLHQGPIHELSLCMKADESRAVIDQIILHLSRNSTLKKLTLVFNSDPKYRLPLSIFSLHHLTDLYLHRCHLDHQPIFSGFGSLKSLFMRDVSISTETLLHLLSNCPLLKEFTLLIHEDHNIGDDSSTIAELFECLPVIEDLSILNWIIQCFAQDGVPKVLSTTLIHLKEFYLEDLYFFDEYGLPFIGLVMRSSPNLEKLYLTIFHDRSLEKSKTDSITLEDYSDIWLEHLNLLRIVDFFNLKHELEFVKLILAKSPVMKKVIIFLDDVVTEDEEMLILKNLSHSPRASPWVEIIVGRLPENER